MIPNPTMTAQAVIHEKETPKRKSMYSLTNLTNKRHGFT